VDLAADGDRYKRNDDRRQSPNGSGYEVVPRSVEVEVGVLRVERLV
jgi:hypothetical protein